MDTSDYIIKPLNPIENELALQAQNSQKTKEQEGSKSYSSDNALMLAFLMIYETVVTSHQSAEREAKSIALNSDMQEKLLNSEQEFNYKIISSGMLVPPYNSVISSSMPTGEQFAQEMMGKVGLYNMQVSSIRGQFSQKINLVKQAAQVETTNMNTTINSSSQSNQEGSGILQMLLSITNLVVNS